MGTHRAPGTSLWRAAYSKQEQQQVQRTGLRRGPAFRLSHVHTYSRHPVAIPGFSRQPSLSCLDAKIHLSVVFFFFFSFSILCPSVSLFSFFRTHYSSTGCVSCIQPRSCFRTQLSIWLLWIISANSPIRYHSALCVPPSDCIVQWLWLSVFLTHLWAFPVGVRGMSYLFQYI